MKKRIFITAIALILMLPGIGWGAGLEGVTLTGTASNSLTATYNWPLTENLISTSSDTTFVGTVTHAGTNRTVIDPDTGLITAVGANLPRFETVGGYKSLLIEPAGTNLITFSEEFDNADWVKNSSTITANDTVSPDGSATADKLDEETDVNHQHYANNFIAKTTFTDDASVTFSVYLKQAERTWVTIMFRTKGADFVGYFFDLANGVVGSAHSGGSDSYSITPAANGFYRCSITSDIENGAIDPRFRINVATADTVYEYNGVAGNGIYLWGAQVEESLVLTSYIGPTTGSAITRATESGEPHALNPTSIFAASGTLIAWVRPSFAYGDVVAGDYGIVACDDAAKSLLYFDENGMVCSWDGSTEATSGAINYASGDWIKAVVKWGDSSFRVGSDTGSGLTWGTAQTFDDAFTTTGGNTRWGYGLFSRQHVRQTLIFDKVLTDTEIGTQTGSP